MVALAVSLGVAVTILAAGLRLPGLTRVEGAYWDEQYYSGDAAAYLGRRPADVRPDAPAPRIDENTWMHPPLGKWMIAVGEIPFGHRELGYRVMPAVFGTAGVAVTYAIGLQLWSSPWTAALPAFLVAVDGLHIVHSRMGMLDIFVSTFVLLGCLLLVRAHRSGHRPLLHVCAGIALGAAVATKWSAIPYLAVAAITAWRWTGRQGGRTLVGAYLGAPAGVYLLSYVPFFTQNGADVGGFVRLQWAMIRYGWTFDYLSPDRSPAWSWPFLGGSINYLQGRYFEGVRIIDGELKVVRVLAIGNPVVWLVFLVAAAWLAAWLAREREWRDAIPLLGYLLAWAPWLLVGRTTFVSYMVPAVPFMALAIGAAVRSLPKRIAVGTGVAIAGATAVSAAVYLPLWTAVPVSLAWFQQLGRLPGVT